MVCFSHGKESGPWGAKITALAKVAEELGLGVISIDYREDRDPQARVERLLREFVPDGGVNVLVGSSMGGYVATVASAHFKPDGLFLLAPALGMKEYPQTFCAPCAGKVAIVHGLNDGVIPCRNSVEVALTHHTELHLVDDDHQLTASLPVICDLFRHFLRSLVSLRH